MLDRHILFTNLSWVTVNGIRTFTHALLLTEGEWFFGPKDRRRYQLRGFGTDPAWPVFDLDVPSLEHTLTDAQSNAIMITDSEPEGRPLVSGAIMQIKDGPRVDLVVNTHKHPIHIDTFEGCITQVWGVLPSRVAHYWDAPAMPTLRWAPPRR